MNSLRQSLQQIMENKFQKGAMLASVIDVDGSMCNVLTLDDEVELKEVRLQAETSNGILIMPAIGSFVVVVPITDFEFVVVMYSAIDSIKFLDGSFGGLTKTQELKTQIDKTNEVVNLILTVLTGTSIPEPGSGAPSALQAALAAVLTGKQVGDFSDIENNKITHGTV